MADEKNTYEVLILGAGPASFAAGIYAARYQIKSCIIGKELGGLAATTHLVENYPGYKSISGPDLMKKMQEHAESLNVPIVQTNIKEAKKEGELFRIITDKEDYFGKYLIVALGTKRRKLNIPGEDKFYGKGVTYCATCDGPLFKGMNVAVVGGGDAAFKTALFMSDIANKVYLLVRSDRFKAEPINIESVKKRQNIEIKTFAEVKEIRGEQLVSSVLLKDNSELKVEAVLIEIGQVPSTAIVKELGIEMDEYGYVKVDKNMATNIARVYAAGDITNETEFKQIITAASQGSRAIHSIFNAKSK
ncbi:thioredoxin reductase [Candidatus Woesearchaeota archaeon]|nr:MAG: thioredoxin reductase [Candidatus Woesearchaeota archaeon]